MAFHIIKADHFPTLAEAMVSSINQKTTALGPASAAVDYVQYNEAEILRYTRLLLIRRLLLPRALRHLLLPDSIKSLRN